MKQKAVDDVSFQIKEGMICGLIGPNGAGKTTIMKMMGGLVLPTEGSLSLFGGSTEEELAKARSRMSFMIETPYAKEKMTARQNLEKQRLQKGIPNKERIDEVLEIVGLKDTGKKPVQKFSLGMRQRLGIANALLTKPEIMVLDEPTAGLDPQGVVDLSKLLRELNDEGITIIISTHEVDLVPNYAQRVFVLVDGLLIALVNIDEVVQTLKQSKTGEEAIKNLTTKFLLSERQAKAILDMRLQSLTGLQIEKLQQEKIDLNELVEYLTSILENHDKKMQLIVDELREIQRKYEDLLQYQLQDYDLCYRLEGTLGTLLDGIVGEMTIEDLQNALSQGTVAAKTEYGQGYAGVQTLSESWAVITFDSNQDGQYDAEVHADISRKNTVDSETLAWAVLDLRDNNSEVLGWDE